MNIFNIDDGSVLSQEDILANNEFYDEMEKAIQGHTIKLEPESSEAESNSEVIKANYKAVFKEDKIGFYQLDSSGEIQISNFVIEFDKWVKTKRNGETLSYFTGKIFIDKEQIPFDRFHASNLSEQSALIKFIENLCGPKAMIFDTTKKLISAIKSINQDVPLYEEKEFGYNETLDNYITEELVITKQEFQAIKTPIKYSDNWGSNRLGFNLVSADEMKKIKSDIIEKLLNWDDPKIMYNALAFSTYPLVYPFLKERNPNKFYLMLKGPSGSGKSQMSRWFQNFYGDFATLLAWTSTNTSINILGSAFKDALLVVDDLKVQNFRTESEAKSVMITLQNYSDGTGRQRANVDLTIRDQRIINGHLMISAEDLVISETSTIARGVIINVNSKSVKMEEVNELNNISKTFSGIMPHFIQHIIKTTDKIKVQKIYDNAYQWLLKHPLISDPGISKDNLPRILNNFASLKVSWEILSEFLFSELSVYEKEEYDATFNHNLVSLLRENIDRINSYKPEIIFETRLWEMLEDGTFYLERISPDGGRTIPNGRSKLIGHYTIDESKNVKIILQLSTIIREIKGRTENFAISEDTLRIKLLNEKKIKTTPSGRFSINGFKARGVSWIGDFPKNLFGLPESFDPIEEASDILNPKDVLEEEDFVF